MYSIQQYKSKGDGTSKGIHRSDRCIQVQQVNASGRMDTSLKVDESQQMATSSRMSICSTAITKLHRWPHSKDGSRTKQAMLRTHDEYESDDEYKPNCECSSNGKYKPDSRHRPNMNTSQLVNKDEHNRICMEHVGNVGLSAHNT